MPNTDESVALMDILRAIAKRADNERIAALTRAERDFAMTLAGRRLLECVRLGGAEFRLSVAARKLLAGADCNVLHRTDSPAARVLDCQ